MKPHVYTIPTRSQHEMRITERTYCRRRADNDDVWAMPPLREAPAAAPSEWSRNLRSVSSKASIGIAVFLALYFAWQFAGRPGL